MPKQITEIDTAEALSILAVGGSGTGKSIAMCSLPGPILNINLDDRITPIVEYYRGYRNDIWFEQPQKFDDLNDIVDSLENDGYRYKTVIIDPLINLSQMLLQYSTALQGKDKGKKRGVIDVAGVEDYGIETKGISDIIFNAKLAQKIHKFHLVFTAHLLTVNHYKVGGALTNTTQEILTAGRKIAAFIPTQFDEIYFFRAEGDAEAKKGRYYVRTYNDGEIAARTSFLNMPAEFEWTGSRDFYGFIKQYFGAKKEKETTNE